MKQTGKRAVQRHTTIILILTHALACVSDARANSARGASENAAPTRHLIICVDGVSFSTIERMRAAGRFKLFRQPARMLAPFPTLTNVAMTEILKPAGAGGAAGYEDSYFDVGRNKMRGGLLDRFRGDRFIKNSFRSLFDYHPSALKSGFGYAAPPLSTYAEALTDLVRLKQKFRSSREPVFFAYTGASDSIAHLGGEWMLRSFLARLDDAVEDLVREAGGGVEVTIFSDHGNDFSGYRRAPLKSALRRAGFKLEGRLKDDRSVVLPQFGLVGSAVMWTREGNEGRLASTCAQVRGVDFAAYQGGGVVHVISRRGRAEIERRGGRYRYRAPAGDPLELNGTLDALARQGKVDQQGFVADADWFAATVEGARPDAVRRVYEGAGAHVRNRADVIVNLADGYYTGSTTLDVFAFLQATHGSISPRQSFGFVISTNRDLPRTLRARDVWAAIGSPALRKAASRNLAARP